MPRGAIVRPGKAAYAGPMGRQVDIAIAGGGLAGGLTALALARTRSDLELALVEAGPVLGSNHRWSWFATDLEPRGTELMACFEASRWAQGYEVRFPRRDRMFGTPYNSFDSAAFDNALRGALPERAILTGTPVASLDVEGVTLADGAKIAARAVIDARGGVAPEGHLEGGWQVFLGRHIRTGGRHGVRRPIVIDARVAQHDAYRFVYTLPLAPDELFVEDTYYADSPALDAPVLSKRIDAYCAGQGWRGEELSRETGVLPVITGGGPPALPNDGIARIGSRGGFVHPLTSYTLPFAVQTALDIADRADLAGPELASFIGAKAREHWRATRFYRVLGRMLFGAARPDRRYAVLEHFHRLPGPLIERFYAGRSTARDKARILTGKPPVPVGRALRALATRGEPLRMETA